MQKAISGCFDSIQDAPQHPRADQNKIWGFIMRRGWESGRQAGLCQRQRGPARLLAAWLHGARTCRSQLLLTTHGLPPLPPPAHGHISVKNSPPCRGGIRDGAASSLDALVMPMRNLLCYVMAAKKMQITVDGLICFWVGNNSSLFDNSSLK